MAAASRAYVCDHRSGLGRDGGGKAYLDASGSSEDKWRRRRRLMRDVLRRPDIQIAIEHVLATRGVARGDAFALLAAHVTGDETVRLRNGKIVRVKPSPREELATLDDYFRMTGFLQA